MRAERDPGVFAQRRRDRIAHRAVGPGAALRAGKQVRPVGAREPAAMILEESVEQTDRVGRQFQLKGVAAVFISSAVKRRNTRSAAAHELRSSRRRAQVLDADAREDQQRDGQRPLDALGATHGFPMAMARAYSSSGKRSRR